MKNIKVTLSIGEIELTPEDIKLLKPIVDEAFANLSESLLKHLRWSSPKAIQTELENLSDDKLLEMAKLNDLNPISGHNISVFTNKLRSELFKRNGLGHKQINHLSYKQRCFLESLGLRF